jgi:hypothetical protein
MMERRYTHDGLVGYMEDFCDYNLRYGEKGPGDCGYEERRLSCD